MKTGILGGTFDPVHLGHLRTAEEAALNLGLDIVYLIPSASPPHKKEIKVLEFSFRMDMARLGVAESPLLEALDLEGRREGLSYSIETLRELNRLLGPDHDLYFIIGIDAFLEIRTWKDYKHLFDFANFVIVSRPGFETMDITSLLTDLNMEKASYQTIYTSYVSRSGNKLIFMETTLMDISSTRIRDLVKKGQSIRFLVTESVRNYIEEKGLYNEQSTD